MQFKMLLGYLPKSWQVIITLFACTYYGVIEIKSQIDTSVMAVRNDIILEARQPTYAIIKNQLDKQLEKLQKDPDDVKTTDIKFLLNQCQGDFAADYIPNLPPNESITVRGACSKLENLYTNRMPYE